MVLYKYLRGEWPRSFVETQTCIYKGENKVNKEKTNIFQSIASISKNILAHVNINYNGATGAIQIDIIPTDSQSVIVEDNRKAIASAPEVKSLPEKVENKDGKGPKEGSLTEDKNPTKEENP